MTEAIGVSAAWATQKIAEQSARWKQQIKPAKQINVPPEIKASIHLSCNLQGVATYIMKICTSSPAIGHPHVVLAEQGCCPSPYMMCSLRACIQHCARLM